MCILCPCLHCRLTNVDTHMHIAANCTTQKRTTLDASSNEYSVSTRYARPGFVQPQPINSKNLHRFAANILALLMDAGVFIFLCRGTVRLCNCVENSSEFKNRRIHIGRSRAFVHLQEFRRYKIVQIVHDTGKDTEYANITALFIILEG